MQKHCVYFTDMEACNYDVSFHTAAAARDVKLIVQWRWNTRNLPITGLSNNEKKS
jgi:hypothetical protein